MGNYASAGEARQITKYYRDIIINECRVHLKTLCDGKIRDACLLGNYETRIIYGDLCKYCAEKYKTGRPWCIAEDGKLNDDLLDWLNDALRGLGYDIRSDKMGFNISWKPEPPATPANPVTPANPTALAVISSDKLTTSQP